MRGESLAWVGTVMTKKGEGGKAKYLLGQRKEEKKKTTPATYCRAAYTAESKRDGGASWTRP
jgi:hypothetical protein